MAIKIFFHICAIAHCVTVIEEQLHAIIYSGLYEKIEGIYCFVTGKDEFSIKYIIGLLSLYGKKIHIVDAILNDPTMERLTLTNMHSHIQPEDKVLYIHSKGVTQTESEKITNTGYWTRAMNYHLIGKHEICLKALNTYDVDVVGTYYTPEPKPHFQGNFWWTTGAYFLTLPKTIGPKYLDPEMYLFINEPRFHVMSIIPKDIPDLYKKSLLPTYYLDLAEDS